MKKSVLNSSNILINGHPVIDFFLFVSIKDRGDVSFGGDEGGEYCCEEFPATLIACSAAYLAAASTCSTLDGLIDLDLRFCGDAQRPSVNGGLVSISVNGELLPSRFRRSTSFLFGIYSFIFSLREFGDFDVER